MSSKRMLGTVAVAMLVAIAGNAYGQCEHKLLPSDGVGSDFAGTAVALDGDLAIIGSATHDHNDGLGPVGGAWIFHWTGETWTETQEILPSDRAAELGHRFGKAVTIDGVVAIIGAPEDDERAPHAGAAYVYRFDGASWIEEQKLFAHDATRIDAFGASVHVSGDIAIVGAERAGPDGDDDGAAYVFTYDGATWTETQELTASDGHRQALFGNAVARDGTVIVVGAHHDGDHTPNGGAAYVFRWNGMTWGQEQKLTAPDPTMSDEFGGAVAIDGDVIVVGCDKDDDRGINSGSVFVYRWSGIWLQEQELTASDGEASNFFGCDVAIAGDMIVAGAHGDDDLGRNTGVVFVFEHDGATWEETGKIHASDAGIDDGLGAAIAMHGDRVIAGAPHEDDNGSAAGAAYVFDLVACACIEDLDGGGAVDFADVLAVLSAWGNTGGPEDLDHSGTVDFGDILAILSAWGPCGSG